MDSMRHLSTSLPRSSRQRAEADLISSFKAAALSVTNLYKSAQSEKTLAREAGYQDALEDLLEFLDKENIGLGDGEGWNVRRWIQSRLEDTSSPRHASEDEEETTKAEDVETRQSSPEVKKASTIRESSDASDQVETRAASEPAAVSQDLAAPSIPPSMHDFSFRANTQLPTNHDREGHQMDIDASTASPAHRPKHNRSKTSSAKRDVRLASPAISLNMTSGAGSKRKLPYSDFFDIGSLNFDSMDRKDNNPRGGKRGRHI